MHWRHYHSLCSALLIIGYSGISVFAADDSPSPFKAGSEPSHAEHSHATHGDESTVQHRFDDAARWSKVFDDPGRDVWQKPEVLIKALEIQPGSIVADLGAGTGYFSRYLSAAVGKRGAVFAVDVEPNLIHHIRDRAEKESTMNVIPILASYDNPRLPPSSLDVLLIVDTYHHIDHRIEYFEKIKALMKPMGRVVIVDFQKRDIPVGPKIDHKLDESQVTAELNKAGYTSARKLDILPYQYVLEFRLPR